VTAAPVREALWLVRGGVPFDVAFQLDDATRAAYCIILSEMEGRTFDFNTMSFKED
jgi:hypothetical protein